MSVRAAKSARTVAIPHQRDAGAPPGQRGASAAWTEERRRSDEGPPPQAAMPARRRLKGGPAAQRKAQSRMQFMTERETPSVDGLVIGILGGTGDQGRGLARRF